MLGIKCKALLDGVKIDFKNKIITLFDLKTTGKSVYEFYNKGFYEYGYYIQSCFYTEAFKLWLDGLAESDHPNLERLNILLENNKLKLNEFKLTDFEFVVVSKKDNREPIISYVVSKETNDNYLVYDRVHEDSEYRCLNNLLFDFQWHLHSDN